jgi:RND family efflux transporter MFP subunit
LPWLLLAGFLVLGWLLFRDRFERGREVELVKVVSLRSADALTATAGAEPPRGGSVALRFDGPTLFQASGWIEPEPLPLRATALYSGVVESVYVLEGEAVEQGQLLARMVDEDAALNLETAQAALDEARAAYLSHEAGLQAAEAFLVSKKREIAAEQARLEELRDESDRLSELGSMVVTDRSIRQAALRVESQLAVLAASEAKRDEAEAAMGASRASLQLAEAAVRRAETEVDRKQLALDRTRIRSPVNGRVQRLFAAPGKKRMLAMDDPESATIATLYEPAKLQARIDVPLGEAERLAVGQPVRIRSSLLPDRIFEGRVTRIEGEADLQRNTLQAKVKILNPADRLRPEMLCRAEFLSLSQGPEQPVGDSVRLGLYVPESSLLQDANGAAVWVLDSAGERVERRDLDLGSEYREGHVRVLAGLRPGDFVVNDPPADLESGERIKRQEE